MSTTTEKKASGMCQGCGQRVEIDVPPNGHARTDHSPRCDGYTCAPDCPVQVLCGPVEPDSVSTPAEPQRCDTDFRDNALVRTCTLESGHQGPHHDRTTQRAKDDDDTPPATEVADAPERLTHEECLRDLQAWFEFALKGEIKSRQTGSGPKFNAYSYVEIPEWSMRQKLDNITAALNPEGSKG